MTSGGRRCIAPRVGVLLAAATLAPALGCAGPAATPATTPAATPAGDGTASVAAPAVVPARPLPSTAPTAPTRGALGRADGVVPAGTTVFDDAVPAVARLDPVLLGALRRAAPAAAGDGLVLVVHSCWRSPAYQQQLIRSAVARYGSVEAASRWVASVDTSAHVSGDAVDLGPSGAATWLSRHGAAYGLCQIYDNEPWHYEFRAEAAANGCPARYADASQDPFHQRSDT